MHKSRQSDQRPGHFGAATQIQRRTVSSAVGSVAICFHYLAWHCRSAIPHGCGLTSGRGGGGDGGSGGGASTQS